MKAKRKHKGTVYFLGAGPGDPKLVTIRTKEVLSQADLVIYAGSLVNPEVLNYTRSRIPVYDSSRLSLEELGKIMLSAAMAGKTVARLHTGDPSLYGAIQEQMAFLDRHAVPYTVIPGVSAVFAAAASVKRELTLPEVSQAVILARLEGKTSVPPAQSLARLAQHRCTMGIFLSVQQIDNVVQELSTVFPPDTPVAVIHKASWPEEKIIRGTLKNIVQKVHRSGIKRQAMILVGDALGTPPFPRSRVYGSPYSHGTRTVPSTKRKGMALIAVTEGGIALAQTLLQGLGNATLFVPEKFRLKGGKVRRFSSGIQHLAQRLFQEKEALIFITAAGIAVRAIAPFIGAKDSDPAVVVLDEKGRHVISLLSGHLGGANELAVRIAHETGGHPIITTATDVHGFPALDVLAKRTGAVCRDSDLVKRFNATLVSGRAVGVFPASLKEELFRTPTRGLRFYKKLGNLLRSPCSARLIISNCLLPELKRQPGKLNVVLRPKNIVVGVGCNRGTTAKELNDTFDKVMTMRGLSQESVRGLATIDAKKNEAGLRAFAKRRRFPIAFFARGQLNAVSIPSPSSAAKQALGVQGVSEPAALLAAETDGVLFPKTKVGNVTFAAAAIPFNTLLAEKDTTSSERVI